MKLNYSPNTFTIELADESYYRVKPLSMMSRMEFFERTEELFQYLKDLNETRSEDSFRDLLVSDIELTNHIDHCLDLVGLSCKTLDPDTILALLFPYEDNEAVQHDRGILFEKNFPESPMKGKNLSEDELKDQLYRHLAELSLHFDSMMDVFDMANSIPAEMLTRITEERSKLMQDAHLTPEDKKKREAKTSAKDALKAMFDNLTN